VDDEPPEAIVPEPGLEILLVDVRKPVCRFDRATADRRVRRVHLLERGRIDQPSPADGAMSQLKLEPLRHVLRARVDPAGRSEDAVGPGGPRPRYRRSVPKLVR